jgi:hypothetical protein
MCDIVENLWEQEFLCTLYILIPYTYTCSYIKYESGCEQWVGGGGGGAIHINVWGLKTPKSRIRYELLNLAPTYIVLKLLSVNVQYRKLGTVL